MTRAALVLLLASPLAGLGCAKEAPQTAADPEPAADAAPAERPMADAEGASPGDPDGEATAPTVFDAAEVVFDTLEPDVRRRIEIPQPAPPRQRPRPQPRPDPEPEPEPLPPPSPAPPVAGSCDVRESEGFCFTYTGATWTADTAELHCSEAPRSSFRAAECPSEGRIATCVFRRGEAPARQIVYTYYEPYDLGLARIACPGRFFEAPR